MSKVLAIIGTAGRGTDASRLTLPVWNEMKWTIYRFVKDHKFRWAISGGAAFADHLAVGMFNAGFLTHLTLALPCDFDWQEGRFADDGTVNWRKNPGGTLHYYHRPFSKMIGHDSLHDIKTAIYNGAEVIVKAGLMERNSVVAEADVVIAFTFGNGPIVKDGGTARTCERYLARGGTQLWHVDLNDMTLHENARVS